MSLSSDEAEDNGLYGGGVSINATIPCEVTVPEHASTTLLVPIFMLVVSLSLMFMHSAFLCLDS